MFKGRKKKTLAAAKKKQEKEQAMVNATPQEPAPAAAAAAAEPEPAPAAEPTAAAKPIPAEPAPAAEPVPAEPAPAEEPTTTPPEALDTHDDVGTDGSDTPPLEPASPLESPAAAAAAAAEESSDFDSSDSEDNFVAAAAEEEEQEQEEQKEEALNVPAPAAAAAAAEIKPTYSEVLASGLGESDAPPPPAVVADAPTYSEVLASDPGESVVAPPAAAAAPAATLDDEDNDDVPGDAAADAAPAPAAVAPQESGSEDEAEGSSSSDHGHGLEEDIGAPEAVDISAELEAEEEEEELRVAEEMGIKEEQEEEEAEGRGISSSDSDSSSEGGRAGSDRGVGGSTGVREVAPEMPGSDAEMVLEAIQSLKSFMEKASDGDTVTKQTIVSAGPQKEQDDITVSDIQAPDPATELVKALPVDSLGPIRDLTTTLMKNNPAVSFVDIHAALLTLFHSHTTTAVEPAEAPTKKASLLTTGLTYLLGASPMNTMFGKFLPFASAAYSPHPFAEEKVTTPGASHEQLVADMTGVSKDKVFFYTKSDAGASKDLPEHYVAVDDDQKTVVVAIRGTNSLRQVLAGLDGGYQSAEVWGKRYRFHAGMYKAARTLDRFPHLQATVEEQLRLNARYRLVLCGHSVGGGVAAILAVLWANPEPDAQGRFTAAASTRFAGRRLECFTYGPAAAVEAELSQRAGGLVAGVVNTGDLVPSLSPGALQGLVGKGSAGAASKKNAVPAGSVWTLAGEVADVARRFGEVHLARGMAAQHMLPAYAASLAPFAPAPRTFLLTDFARLAMGVLVGNA